MIKVLKASAGSGKTYNLALEYIRLLVSEQKPDAYRHVLAVTFTNKATEEMKRRILKELHLLATEPEKSPYLKSLQEGHPELTAAVLQKRAGQQLSAILHDYSSFAVSTIDKFFQQTLRAFSREIGQFASYQVQLDREAMVAEGVDRVLDGLDQDNRPLLDWLTESVKADLGQSGRFSLERRLLEMGGSLSDLEGETPSREKLQALHRECTQLMEQYRQRVIAAAKAVEEAFAASGVDLADTNRHFLAGMDKWSGLRKQDPVLRPSASFLKTAADPDQWFAKAKAQLRQQVEGRLNGPLDAFCALFDKPYKEYTTAAVIRDQVYSLGVAGELREAFSQIQKEKNILSIDDSNTILKGIIDGTDTPFIYEKLGVRYEDFLLDEFQDTATIQWDNLKPLLKNSDDSGFFSLVVGDVKQSIYRWRGSDWSLLGSRLQEEFPRSEVKPLQQNHRTCHQIVQFNNDFFQQAAQWLGLDSLYADVRQEACFDDPAPGSVQVRFVEDQMAEVLLTLRQKQAEGARWSDITVLVRGNAEGAAVAAALVQEGIPVVSDDALYVKTSVTVRRLVSQLSLADTPENPDGKPSVAGYLAGSLELEIPNQYHSLVDLAEGLLRELRQADPAVFEADIPYIQSFMDYLQDWVATGGNNLGAFLRAWADADPRIASPSTGDSVRIMTVHKAKGLEFPFVIFPFAEKVTLYKANDAWCAPAVEGTALEEAAGTYRVSLDQKSADTFFDAHYEDELRLQAVDNLNIFYVALTRPIYGIKIISALPPKKMPERPSNMAQLLYQYVGALEYDFGTPYDFSKLKRKDPADTLIQAGYTSYPTGGGKRLRFSPEAADYFGPDGVFGPEASNRIRGNVLHGILSHVAVPEQLPAAVTQAVRNGELPEHLKEKTLSFLQERLEQVASYDWFSDAVQVRMETPILGPDGHEHRPDRVVLHPDGRVDIIDYKFGKPEEAYLWQVRSYRKLYRQMGYTQVSGYIWYLEDGQIITT